MTDSWKDHIKNNKYFCILPFNHMHISTNGHANVCCVGDWKYPVSEDITKTSMNAVWTGDVYQQIRKDMLDGKPVKQCNKCYQLEEDSGGGSDRMIHNGWFNAAADWDIDVKYGNSNKTPHWVDWRPGRFCNLGCRMCFVGVSSTIANEHKDNPFLKNITGETWFEVNDWIENDKLFSEITEWLPHLKTLKLAGGEPFFMTGVIKLLKYCIDTNNTHLHLDITTNGTRMQGKVLKWLEQFKNVDIQFSIDGVGYTNDYIRYGADWTKLSAAYKKYLGMSVKTHLLATVQAYNAYDLVNIINYWKDNGKNGNLIFNFVDSPADLQIDILPLEERLNIANKIELASADFTPDQLDAFRINATIHRLRNTNTLSNIKELQKKFAIRTVAYDKLRNQSINDVHPTLAQLVTEWQ